MSDVVTVEVLNPTAGHLTVEILGGGGGGGDSSGEGGGGVLDLAVQSGTTTIDVVVGIGKDGKDGIDGTDGIDGEGADLDEVTAIAAGSTLGLQQLLLAKAGQAAQTVLAVGYTDSGKVQGCSLGNGNVVEVFATGADFDAGNVLYREFMALGEPICFTGLTTGAIITATEGFYGVSEQYSGSGPEGPMPLLSYGLAFSQTFVYGFRFHEQGDGYIRLVNGPLANKITLTDGFGAVQLGQENIELDPWQAHALDTDGDKEYTISCDRPVMACVHAGMLGTRYADNRLVMPLTNDGITWPLNGFMSAPYDNTPVDWYARDGESGSLNSGLGVSPGNPIAISADAPLGTGVTEESYRPDGATRFVATGLISSFSGADSAGLDATAMMPVSALSQVVAQPFHIADTGEGGVSSVALASPYECEAKIYEWDDVAKDIVLKYELQLTRSNITVTAPNHQLHPASAAVSNDTAYGAVELVGQLNPGVIIATAPIMAVCQKGDVSLQPEIRSQDGTTAMAVRSDKDEVVMLGWTPDNLRAEITTDENGLLRRRKVDASGAETWVLT